MISRIEVLFRYFHGESKSLEIWVLAQALENILITNKFLWVRNNREK